MDEIESQLSQMRLALALAEDSDKPGIQMIIDQLQELLGVYAVTAQIGDINNSASANNPSEIQSAPKGDKAEDDDEYRLFQSEIAALDSENSSDRSPLQDNLKDDANSINDNDKNGRPAPSTNDTTNSIGNELEDLIGMKCMAPHQENWGQIGYYCAMISSVLSLEQGGSDSEEPSDISSIMVRVIFMQPVVKSQLLCPFFKEDRCRFSDEDCNFSHGEIVPLSQLREYSEPDYSSIVPGSRVLAKYHDDLWYKATVQRITAEGDCEVSYDVGNEALVIPLHETTPLNDSDTDDPLSDNDSSDEDDIENPNISSSDSEINIPKTLMGDGLLEMKGGSSLGDWEKFTKGIGSRLMLKMGYVFGTGLGKNKEGRVEPVDAIVLPPGKSLDACMALKEKAKDGNLFSAEKRRLKHQRKADKQRAKLAAQKPKEEANVFEFLNSKLSLRKTNSSNSSKKHNPDLRKQTCSNLNKRLFGLDESLSKVKKDMTKTKKAMKRHKGKDKETYSLMEKKLEALESQHRELDTMQNSVANEQRLRLEKRKLLSF